MIRFNVGANDGGDIKGNETIYAFEPNPVLAKRIRAKHGNNPNYHFHEVAVSDFNGKATFNVCDQMDMGCSSLLPLSANAATMWNGRNDMFPTSNIEVNVIRLDSLDWSTITEVEHFHCDAQGSDLRVLQGLGEYLKRIKSGVVECAKKHECLYVGQNSLEDTRAFLIANRFTITHEDSNDTNSNEVNLKFQRI
jgi:FkbM family methyltransferase